MCSFLRAPPCTTPTLVWIWSTSWWWAHQSLWPFGIKDGLHWVQVWAIDPSKFALQDAPNLKLPGSWHLMSLVKKFARFALTHSLVILPLGLERSLNAKPRFLLGLIIIQEVFSCLSMTSGYSWVSTLAHLGHGLHGINLNHGHHLFKCYINVYAMKLFLVTFKQSPKPQNNFRYFSGFS